MTKQSDREIVHAFIDTLPDKHMKDIYQLLTERYDIHKAKYLLFNKDGIQCKAPDGKVRLRPYQMERLIKSYGDFGFQKLCEIMWGYIDFLEQNTESVYRGKQKLKELQVISHYHIMGKGWVAQKFNKMYPQVSITEEQADLIDFFDVNSKEQAIEFIRQTPEELRFDNPDIIFLVDKYNINIDKEV